MDDFVSYNDAALMIGCDHHYVRMLASRGRLEVHHREEVKPNVLKVFLTRASVEDYMESQRVRRRYVHRWTVDEEAAALQAVMNLRIAERSDNGSNR